MGWHATRQLVRPAGRAFVFLLDDESVPWTPEATPQAELPSYRELEFAETSLAWRNRDFRKDACWPEWGRVLLFSVCGVLILESGVSAWEVEIRNVLIRKDRKIPANGIRYAASY
jgi:hypothetical protein